MRPRERRRRDRLGLLALAAIPCGALVAQKLADVGLLQSLYVSVPARDRARGDRGLVGRAAARFALDRSVSARRRRASCGSRSSSRGRGLWRGIIGGMALGVYGALALGQ